MPRWRALRAAGAPQREHQGAHGQSGAQEQGARGQPERDLRPERRARDAQDPAAAQGLARQLARVVSDTEERRDRSDRGEAVTGDEAKGAAVGAGE